MHFNTVVGDVEHNVFTHFPKSPTCDICNKCITMRAPHRTLYGVRADGLPPPTAFADALTADHKILADEGDSRSGNRVALIITDRFAGWTQSYPAINESAAETKSAF